MDKNSVTELVQRYIAMWNETEDQVRRDLIDDLFTPNGTYTDPIVVADGTAAIDEYIGASQKNFTGMLFTFDTVLTHHDAVHFSWQVGPTGEAPVVSGFDVAWLEGGRIGRLCGFFIGT
ncbi:nuclear transport factor 2 family protein [Streptomyces europaeiscabiei]|uniref:nuclear transport factor 2 family protein n=1 Tax=Streptomyces europaeiscabiei TaxID=146819 RepID=UPI0029BBF180|nr:nuclear transport factor 2 family protein [Streptomyces europaeiscabiei]MDX3867462.1 nuclear transport factor 2 family protein [Streptomyces europaeiscabiei]MDX3874204.1 nuclear transport factor 2 family protein [Streptomyces europaeiscabiei]